MINTETARALLSELQALLLEVDEAAENAETNNKSRSATHAEVNRRLLYGAHLADTARLEIMNQYHTFKGESPPVIGL